MAEAHLQVGGYWWRRYKVDRIDPIDVQKHEKPVHQYAVNGEYIASYNSMAEAAHSLGKPSGSVIGVACKKKTQYAYGYRWSHAKAERLPDIERRNNWRKVVRISLDGEEQIIYESIAQAARENNARECNINATCNGRAHTCAGYRWKYLSDLEQERGIIS